jgi:hypothetical protein
LGEIGKYGSRKERSKAEKKGISTHDEEHVKPAEGVEG